MCIGALLACMRVYHKPAWCLWRPEKNIRSPETGVTGGCEPPHGCQGDSHDLLSCHRSKGRGPIVHINQSRPVLLS